MPGAFVFRLLSYICLPEKQTEIIAQLVRASDCGSEGRGFDPHLSPKRLQKSCL